MAIPIEKIAVNMLTTCSSAPSTFFTSAGKIAISTAPIAQKKLIDRMARNKRRMCNVARTSSIDAWMMCQLNGIRPAAGGGGGDLPAGGEEGARKGGGRPP